MHQDRWGYQLTTDSQRAAKAYAEGVDRLLPASAEMAAPFQEAVAADDGFALAHIARRARFRCPAAAAT